MGFGIGAGSLPYEIIRGINHADSNKIYYSNEEKNHDTGIIKFADEKADSFENKSGLTIALEDYAKKCKIDDQGVSYIPSSKMGKNWFAKLAEKIGITISDNVFKSDAAEKVAEKEGSYYQKDIFKACMEEHGGLQYAKEGDDLFESAVNFAKADIEALEHPYDMCVDNWFFSNKQLDSKEVNSFRHDFDAQPRDMKELNFTKINRSSLNAKEVASYILAADTNKDGIITEEESLAVKNGKNADIIADAREIYEENK